MVVVVALAIVLITLTVACWAYVILDREATLMTLASAVISTAGVVYLIVKVT